MTRVGKILFIPFWRIIAIVIKDHNNTYDPRMRVMVLNSVSFSGGTLLYPKHEGIIEETDRTIIWKP